MKEVIKYYRDIVIQIATPLYTGTGFYLKGPGLIITNAHNVHGSKEAIIKGEKVPKQLARVLYLDPKYDLAFLEAPPEIDLPAVELAVESELGDGDKVIALGHPFGLKFATTQGIISNANLLDEDTGIKYIQHDAALNPGNSGGPLVDEHKNVVGINTFIIRDGDNIGFSLPAVYIGRAIEEFTAADGGVRVRCAGCNNVVSEEQADNKKYCPHCGAELELPSQAEEYEPAGVAMTIEELIGKAGHNVRLSRRGANNWEIQQGSARINISYHEETGLISGDAYLCMLPSKDIKPLYEYLLRQNYLVEGLAFSIKDQDVILSLLIFDRYLNLSTGMKLFKHLFDCADQFDNILVEQYGASWKYEEESTDGG